MADKPSTPRVISPIYHSLNQTSRLRSRRWLNVGIILLVVVAVIVGSLLVKNHKEKGQASAAHAVRLVYVNSSKGQLSLEDNTGGVLAHTSSPVGMYASYEALSPDGAAIVSFGSPDPQEIFTMVGGSQTITADSQKALRTADYQGGSHNLIFINASTVLYTTCLPNSTCKVDALNLSRGKTFQVADTGLKPQPPSAYCYLLGKSGDGTSVYLRVSGRNSLGKSTSAVYQINSYHGNVIRTIQVPTYAGFDLSLSPDTKTLAFSAAKPEKDGKTQTVIYLLDTYSGKQTSVDWPQVPAGTTSGKLEWSPDGQKLLMHTASIRVQAGSKQTPPPIYVSYLDTATNRITNLQTIGNAHLNELVSTGWLDNGHAVYDQLVASRPYDFTASKSTVYKQDINSKSSVPMENQQGQLLGAAF